MIDFDFITDIGEDDIRVQVHDYIKVKPWKGSAHDCPSDWDYHGYEDFQFKAYDMEGNLLTLSEFEKSLIEDRIREHVQNIENMI